MIFTDAFKQGFPGQDQPDQLIIEPVFYPDERGSHLHQRGLIGALATGHHAFEPAVGFLYVGAQFAQTQHP